MRRSEFISLLGSAAMWPRAAGAQHAGKFRCVAYFSAGAAAARSGPGLERASVEALSEWVEVKSLALESRFDENHPDPLPDLAAELVHLEVDVLVTDGTLAPLAAKRVTSTIPIVMAPAVDPPARADAMIE